MSSKPQQKGQQQQKRKADAQPAADSGKQQQPKKSKDNNGAAAAPAAAAAAPAPAAKKQGAAQPKQQGKEQQGKKKNAAPKAAEPEPEDEDEEEEDEGEDGREGEPNPAALAACDAVQGEMDTLAESLDKLDEQQSAEIFAVQKKILLLKRPVLSKRDQLLSKVPGLWKTLFSEHEVFAVQLEEVDVDILDHLTTVEITENYSAPKDPKQQIVSVDFHFTFSAGSALVKAGKFKKTFKFNDERETLQCVATPAAQQPFVNAAQFAKEHGDSFFGAWYASEGDDEGILRAQDALSSELYIDPLQLFRHVAEGGQLSDITGAAPEDDEDDDDDEDGLAMAFGEDGEEEDDEEAPELADE